MTRGVCSETFRDDCQPVWNDARNDRDMRPGYGMTTVHFAMLHRLRRQSSGAGLMNTVITDAGGKPSIPQRGYSYVHDSKLRQPVAERFVTTARFVKFDALPARFVAPARFVTTW